MTSVDVFRVSSGFAEVCAPAELTALEVLRCANEEYPTGQTWGWHHVDHLGAMPCCKDPETHVHYLLER
jgi:hypothetical protein